MRNAALEARPIAGRFGELIRVFPQDLDYQDALASTYNNLSVAQRVIGEPDKAIASSEKSIEIRLRLVSQRPNVIAYQQGLAAAYNNIGNLFFGSEGYMTIDGAGNWKTFMGKNREPGPSGSGSGNMFDNFGVDGVGHHRARNQEGPPAVPR